jgi:ankyrin repeat protein
MAAMAPEKKDAVVLPLPAHAHEKPSVFLCSMLPEVACRNQKRNITFRAAPTQEEMENYDIESVRAIRANDITTLRALLEEGKSFDACNRSGETLLHLACRRGNIETVNFLVHEAHVKVDVQDDMGRTVLHDLCWRPTPNTEMMESLLRVVSPELLLSEDVRGHSCFDYCRKNDWGEWVAFLSDCSHVIKRQSKLIQTVTCGLEGMGRNC